mgnify:FL=1
MKKNFFILNIFFIILLVIAVLIVQNKITTIDNLKKNKENTREISIEPYSNENNSIKILVNVVDTEYGIEKVIYKNNKNEDITIKAYGKNKISFDYNIEKDGEYIFTAYNKNGDKIEKKLIIDSVNKENDTLGDLIDININPIIEAGYTAAKKANVNINFKYGKGTNYYKIGNTTTWKTYDNEFQIDSNTILENNLQEEDNRTITIFAKKEDEVNNKIEISKSSTELDLDIPSSPEISIKEIDPYATITEYNVVLNAKFKISFDTRNDIKNYYSVDNKNTWIEYTGEVSCKTTSVIYAKSVKNNSGLTIEKSIVATPSASDALNGQAFDYDRNTYESKSGNRLRINLDSTIINKKVFLLVNMRGNNNSYTTSIKIYKNNGINTTILYKGTGGYTGVIEKVITIPEGASYISFEGNNELNIYEVNTANEPEINIDKYYPQITERGIEVAYAMAKINYTATSVKKLYKINDGEWKNYEDKEIRLEIGEKLYAKGIDTYGIESRKISEMTATIIEDGLGKEAYDKNLNTYYDCSNKKLRIFVDKSAIGKKVRLRLNMVGNNWTYITSVKIYKNDGTNTTILEKGSGGSTGIFNHEFIIPENSNYIEFGGNNNMQLYEIERVFD